MQARVVRNVEEVKEMVRMGIADDGEGSEECGNDGEGGGEDAMCVRLVGR